MPMTMKKTETLGLLQTDQIKDYNQPTKRTGLKTSEASAQAQNGTLIELVVFITIEDL